MLPEPLKNGKFGGRIGLRAGIRFDPRSEALSSDCDFARRTRAGQSRDAGGPAPDFFRMAVDLGAATCLRKPFTSAALLAAVGACFCWAQAPRVA